MSRAAYILQMPRELLLFVRTIRLAATHRAVYLNGACGSLRIANALFAGGVLMRRNLALLVVLGVALLRLTCPVVGASINDFLSYSLVDSNNNVLLPGRLHVPTEYDTDPNTLRPLVLFLHGSGESGTNNLTQINGNIDNLLTASKARGAFLYAPQTNIGWENSTLLSEAMTM